MRTPVGPLAFLVSAIFLASPACADGLTFPNENQLYHATFASRPFEQPWVTQRPEPYLVQRPLADLIATKIGVVEGSAQLFRFRLENAPSNATIVKGQLNGAGIRVKLSW